MMESPSTQGEPSTSARVCGLCKFSLLLPHALSCHNSAQLLVLFLSRYEPIDYDLLFSIVQDVKP